MFRLPGGEEPVALRRRRCSPPMALTESSSILPVTSIGRPDRARSRLETATAGSRRAAACYIRHVVKRATASRAEAGTCCLANAAGLPSSCQNAGLRERFYVAGSLRELRSARAKRRVDVALARRELFGAAESGFAPWRFQWPGDPDLPRSAGLRLPHLAPNRKEGQVQGRATPTSATCSSSHVGALLLVRGALAFNLGLRAARGLAIDMHATCSQRHPSSLILNYLSVRRHRAEPSICRVDQGTIEAPWSYNSGAGRRHCLRLRQRLPPASTAERLRHPAAGRRWELAYVGPRGAPSRRWGLLEPRCISRSSRAA